jgi:methionine biosynthesis protein MetW
MGVEKDQQAIVTCVRRGLDVVQADLNQGLPTFADQQFDYVVLSQTLQAVLDVEKVLADVLRIGRRGIVSFPNFGYWKLRAQLARQGRAPRSSTLRFDWYNTPNVRFLSIDDFEDFCGAKAIRIHRRIALDTETDRQVEDYPNLQADVAIMVISQ